MFRNIRIWLFACIAGLAADDTLAGRNDLPVDRWLTQQLIPTLSAQLDQHPRFRDQVVRFVVVEEGAVTALSNHLVLELKSTLQAEILDLTNLQIAWQPAVAHPQSRATGRALTCSRNSIDYYITLDFAGRGDNGFQLVVDVIDVAAGTSVPGFRHQWSGRLTAEQFRDYRRPDADAALLGQRNAPFDESQTDLLAAYLAHELGCSLLRELSGEYVAAISPTLADSNDKLMMLVRNNLASYKALQITTDAAAANAVIDARAHRISSDLYQYWITITPISAESSMPTLGANAYAYDIASYAPALLGSAIEAESAPSGAEFIESISLVELDNHPICQKRAGTRQRLSSTGDVNECLAIQANMNADTAVFLLYHQLNHGLVRISPDGCAGRSTPRISRRDEPLFLPLLLDTSSTPSWRSASEWYADPRTDTFYVVAVRDTRAARALANHLRQLPERCGRTLRPGLEEQALRDWFGEFEAIGQRWTGAIDWRSVRIKNVY